MIASSTDYGLTVQTTNPLGIQSNIFYKVAQTQNTVQMNFECREEKERAKLSSICSIVQYKTQRSVNLKQYNVHWQWI